MLDNEIIKSVKEGLEALRIGEFNAFSIASLNSSELSELKQLYGRIFDSYTVKTEQLNKKDHMLYISNY